MTDRGPLHAVRIRLPSTTIFASSRAADVGLVPYDRYNHNEHESLLEHFHLKQVRIGPRHKPATDWS